MIILNDFIDSVNRVFINVKNKENNILKRN